MNDVNDLCKRAAKLLGWRYRYIDMFWTFEDITSPRSSEAPWQCGLEDALAALEAKLRERCHSFNLWWDTKTNKYRADWVRLGAPHYLSGDSARTAETEARLAGAIQEAERLQHEGKWE